MSIGDSGNSAVFISGIVQSGCVELRVVTFSNTEQDEHHGEFNELYIVTRGELGLVVAPSLRVLLLFRANSEILDSCSFIYSQSLSLSCMCWSFTP